jgi:hypothetical protein
MKTIKIFFSIVFLLQSLCTEIHAQDQKKVEGPRWRVGLNFQYSSSFKNIKIDYGSLGYTGVLGGFSGKGLSVFGGYKIHRYLSVELETGVLLNSYNRTYSNGIIIMGRFNKFYLHPSIKFLYPIIKKNYTTVNLYAGGGLGLNASGRFYLEDRYDSYRDVLYAKYDPMVAPFIIFGTELFLGNVTNIIVGFKYQNGNYNARYYSDSTDPFANINNAPQEIKTLNAQGLGFSLGLIQEF